MKRLSVIVVLLLIILISSTTYLVFAPATAFSEKSKSFVIQEGENNKESLVSLLSEKEIVKYVWAFELLGNQFNIWNKIKSGKFEVKRSENLLGLVRMIRNNKQVQVKLVINKFRTNEEFAKLIGKGFSTDSITALRFISNNDSLSTFDVDSNNLASIIIPNTYSFYWGTSLHKIISRLKSESDDFWEKEKRKEKAAAMGFKPHEIITIASIVEEETNKEADKGKIASVYINRLQKGMNLGADPTIKFALKNFALKRILFQHLGVESPFNTYKNKGLPPGPICTPSINTIDAVLNAPTTSYIYFVAKPDFSGFSNFSSNFAEHSQYAKQYQQALNIYLSKKQAEQK